MSKVPIFVVLGQDGPRYWFLCFLDVWLFAECGCAVPVMWGVMLNDAMNELNRLRLRISQSKDYL